MAARAGHTIPGVVGPGVVSALLARDAVHTVLIGALNSSFHSSIIPIYPYITLYTHTHIYIYIEPTMVVFILFPLSQYNPSNKEQGILPLRRGSTFKTSSKKSKRWRADLEVALIVEALRRGCFFRLTGNDIWLCEALVPPEAIAETLKPKP